mgnify:CR=1 FL=1
MNVVQKHIHLSDLQSGQIAKVISISGDPREIARAIRSIVDDWEGWQRRSATGLARVREHYVWSAHADEYLSMLRPLLESDPATRERPPAMPVEMGGRQYGVVAGRPPPGGTRQPTYADRMLVSDLNRCLLGDEVALAAQIVSSPEYIGNAEAVYGG